MKKVKGLYCLQSLSVTAIYFAIQEMLILSEEVSTGEAIVLTNACPRALRLTVRVHSEALFQ